MKTFLQTFVFVVLNNLWNCLIILIWPLDCGKSWFISLMIPWVDVFFGTPKNDRPALKYIWSAESYRLYPNTSDPYSKMEQTQASYKVQKTL